MRIVDGHLDLAYNAVELRRELTLPVAEIRRREGTPPPHREGVATVSLPALRTAGVRVACATIFTYPADSAASAPLPGYRSPEEAYRRAVAHIDYYQQLQARGEATILHDRHHLAGVLDGRLPAPGLLLLMEGADPIRTPADVEYFAARGVRAIGLAWKATRYAGGAGAPGPLTAAGGELLRAMARLGITLDASHLAEEAFRQALDCFDGRVIASHANCRALAPGERQLSDAMIRAIAARDGVIGLIWYNRFIRPTWTSADGKAAVHLRDLLPHVEHLAQLVGIRHVALGSDLDGGIGRDDIPAEIDTIADLPRFAGVLAGAGYRGAEVAAVMGENWLRYWQAMLPG